MRALLFLALSACAVDDTDVQEEALTQPPPFTPPTAPPHIPGTQQVCFLDGVRGLLSDTGKHTPARHTVSVDNAGYISGDGEAACLTVFTSSIRYLAWGTNEKGDVATNTSLTGDADTHCFLTNVQGSGLNTGQIALTHTGNAWSFSSSYNGGSSSIPGYAEAICFDYTPSSEWWFGFSATTPLQDAYPSGAPVPTSGVTCGLTSIAGMWTQYDSTWLDRTGANLVFDISGPVSAGLNCVR